MKLMPSLKELQLERWSSLTTRMVLFLKSQSSTPKETRYSFTRQVNGKKRVIHQQLFWVSHCRWTKFSGIGWYFNKFFPHTEMFESFIRRSIEAGLTDAWKKKTWTGMREEYLASRKVLSNAFKRFLDSQDRERRWSTWYNRRRRSDWPCDGRFAGKLLLSIPWSDHLYSGVCSPLDQGSSLLFANEKPSEESAN